jgi:hypothetical protein
MSTTPLSTLLLDTVAWDLVLDSNGNIALATPPYSTAQDVASAIRTFLGEVYYDTTTGVPYWQQLLGQPLSQTLVIRAMNSAALTVPGVVSSNTVITNFSNCQVSGQVQFSTSDGATSTINF